MPLFGGKHYSNPAVGRSKEGETSEKGLEHGKDVGMGHEERAGHHSIHGYFHEDGTAHTHLYHADGTHEHMDHGSHQEAHDHLKSAMDGMGPFESEQGEEAAAPEHESMHTAMRSSGGAY